MEPQRRLSRPGIRVRFTRLRAQAAAAVPEPVRQADLVPALHSDAPRLVPDLAMVPASWGVVALRGLPGPIGRGRGRSANEPVARLVGNRG